MPNVPYTGVPTSEPTQSGGLFQQNIRSDPTEFGGLIGGAEKELGGDLGKLGGDLGRSAVETQELHNQIVTQDAYNKLEASYINLTFGDPKNPSAKGIYGLYGKDAQDAYPAVREALDTSRANLLGNMQNDAQRIAFESASRRLQNYTLSRIGTHVDNQQHAFGSAVAKAQFDVQLQNAGLNYNDQIAQGQAALGARDAALSMAKMHVGASGLLTPEITQQALGIADAQTVERAVLAQAATGEAGAAKAMYMLNNWTLPPRLPGDQPVRYIDALNAEQKERIVPGLQSKADNAAASGAVLNITTGGMAPKARYPIGNIVTSGEAQPLPSHVGFNPNDPANARALSLIRDPGMRQAAEGAAKQYDIPLPEFVATGMVEGRWNPANPDGAAGEVGPLQIKPATGQMVGFNLTQLRDPVTNVYAGAAYWRRMQDASGNNPIAAAGAYNTGAPGQATPDYMKAWSGHYANAGRGAVPILSPGESSGARDAAIPPRYFDQMRMIQQAYDVAKTMPPQQAIKVINGVFEQVSHLNALENQAEAQAQKNLMNVQRDNEATLFGAAVLRQPIAEGDLGEMIRTQRISPAAYNAIRSVQQKIDEGQDDPTVVMHTWDAIGNGNATNEQIFQGVNLGFIKGTTANEMIKAINSRAKTQGNELERGDYNTLKTALGGHALESGMMDIFGTGKQAHAQLWVQAQTEWNQRVMQKHESPDAVLADMLPRYQKSLPNSAAAWPNPRFGAVQTIPDIAAVAAKTKDAFTAGQIDQGTYNAEGELLDRYRRYFLMQAEQKAAADKAKGAQGVRGRSSTLAPTEGNP